MPQMEVMGSATHEDLGDVTQDIVGLRTIMVNLYGVRSDAGGWVLIDTGLPFSANTIRHWAERHFGGPPRSILLTHGHFDHIGAVKELSAEWDIPVYAHRLEMPYLTGRSSYPPPDPSVGRGLWSTLSPLFPKKPINLSGRIRTLSDGGSVPDLPGWRWLHTPGHTAGHVSFFRDSDRALIAGDAFVTTQQEALFAVLTQRVELNGPPAYYTSDWTAARRSVELLASLEPNLMACGHGLPLSGPDALRDLHALARNFEVWALPKQGRYVRHPAITSSEGVVSLPPVIGNPLPKVLVAGAALGGLFWAWKRWRAA